MAIKRTLKRLRARAMKKVAPPRLFKAPLPGFDPIYYLFWYRDVATNGMDPLRHFLDHGWREGRDPSAGFSTRGYLAANRDVARARVNPLIHFLENGFAEGRRGWEKDPRAPAPPPSLDPEVKLLPPPKAGQKVA